MTEKQTERGIQLVTGTERGNGQDKKKENAATGCKRLKDTQEKISRLNSGKEKKQAGQVHPIYEEEPAFRIC